MRLLLDTHAFLWFAADDSRLSAGARRTIEDETNDVFLSAASHWEMAVKMSLGKLSSSRPFRALITEEIERNAMTLLPIEISHTEALLSLPLHHRDPFDRLLVAQATVEKLSLVSKDSQMDAYGVSRIW